MLNINRNLSSIIVSNWNDIKQFENKKENFKKLATIP